MAMFTSSQVSDRLGIPQSTLRRYTKILDAYLSPESQRQRGRRYTEKDVALLARARELFGQGHTVEEVARALLSVAEQAVSLGSEEAVPAAETPSGDDTEGVAAHSEDRDRGSGHGHELWMEKEPGEAATTAGTVRDEMASLMKAVDQLRSDHQELRARIESMAKREALSLNRQVRDDERLEVVEYRLSRLEEWLRLPWYRRLFSTPDVWGQ